MAFDYTNIYPDTSGNGGYTKSWNYTTVGDSIAVCSAPGYFNKVSSRLGIGDNIFIAVVDAFDKTRTALLDFATLMVATNAGGLVTTTNVLGVGLGGAEKLVTAEGDVTLVDSEPADVIGITNTTGGGINVFLPSASARFRKITIVDRGGTAGTKNLTVKPKVASGQKIMTGTQYVIDSNGASIGLTPWADGTGYH